LRLQRILLEPRLAGTALLLQSISGSKYSVLFQSLFRGCGYTFLKSEFVKEPAVILFVLPIWLWAADSWQSKPFTEWSDKELRRVLTNSPWARVVSIAAGPPAGERAGGRGAEPGSRPQGADPSTGPGIMVPAGGSASGPADAREMRSGQTLHLTVRWQSALPVKQALVRVKYGNEASTSPEAKSFLDQEKSTYVIAVSGLPAVFAPGDLTKETLKQQTGLSAKGKDRLQPSDIVFAPQGEIVDVYFVFPKSRPFTLYDKDVEFSTKLGALTVRLTFHLKEMVYTGELAL